MWHEARKQERLLKSMYVKWMTLTRSLFLKDKMLSFLFFLLFSRMVDHRRRAERRREYYEKTVSKQANNFELASSFLGKHSLNLSVVTLFSERRSCSVPSGPWQAHENSC